MGSRSSDYFFKVIAGSTKIQDPIAGDESGVVVSQKGASRQFFQKTFTSSDCGSKSKGMVIRYSLETIPDPLLGPLVAYEIFVKDPDYNEVIGLAYNSKGQELSEVPKEIAFDKEKLKKRENAELAGDRNFIGDQIVRTRIGCFSCHPSVSREYGVSGQEEFWSDARLVGFLTKELSPPSEYQNPIHIEYSFEFTGQIEKNWSNLDVGDKINTLKDTVGDLKNAVQELEYCHGDENYDGAIPKFRCIFKDTVQNPVPTGQLNAITNHLKLRRSAPVLVDERKKNGKQTVDFYRQKTYWLNIFF